MSTTSRGGRKWLAVVLLASGCLALATAAFLLGSPRSAVDWSALKVVALESDDWGLAGFSPSPTAWSGLDRNGLAPGNFPDVYWNSTLEDSLMVAGLCRVLAGVTGADGLPAVLQPNYVLGSLAWSSTPGEGNWREYSWPDFPDRYQRPGLEQAVDDAIAAGLWYPELHARWHYDPMLRKKAVAGSALARKAAERGIMLFPGSEQARELGSWRDPEILARELQQSRTIFAAAFGRMPGSVIAPDYTWNPGIEEMWASQGLTVIQAKREQRNPDLGRGMPARLKKYLLRKWDLHRHAQRKYLERNCRLEPVQSPDPGAVVDQCLEATRRAWRAGQPAIVETHRINYAHLDPEVVHTGQESLAAYLAGITSDPAGIPVFLTDVEIARLQSGGTSWIRRGTWLILRNGSCSSRLLAVPVEAFPDQISAETAVEDLILVKMPARSVALVLPGQPVRTFSFR